MKRLISFIVAAVLIMALTGCTKESIVLYDSDLLRVERAGAVTTISDLEGGNVYTLKTVRVKKSETATQDKATAKTIADTDTMHIQVVHDVLIVTFKGSGDTVYTAARSPRIARFRPGVIRLAPAKNAACFQTARALFPPLQTQPARR